MTSLTKIQLSSDDRVSNASAEMERRESEDTGVSVNTASEQSKDTRDDDFNDDNHSKNNIDGSEDLDILDDCHSISSPSPLVRYKSLRDHNGRYCLVVKIA
jgi:hypothetical protein